MAHLIYLRNDLRILDHDIFHKLQHEEIIPLYIFDENTLKNDVLNQPRLGDFRKKLLLEGLQSLRKELQERGGNLMIATGSPKDVIAEIHKKTPLQGIHFYQHDAPEELDRTQEIESLNIPMFSYAGDYLYHPEDLPFSLEKIPFVFTAFRKKVEKYAEVRPFFPTPSKFSVPSIIDDWGEIPAIPNLKIDERSAFPYLGGTRGALDRLEHYFWNTDLLAEYKETRNGMTGVDYSSKFSPWLAQGSISARFIFHQVKKYEKLRQANESTYWLIFELIWRDFFRFTAASEGGKFFKIPRNYVPKTSTAFEKWKEGKTGNAFIDAAMIELRSTGYTSNRARQNVASYLVHDLNQPWYAGALWFESVLIDYDVYSNYGNWTYVAGVGHDPRSRKFNIQRQADMYDADETFRNTWLNGEF
ncbi:MAG: DASH family cryptochrome [Flavobacteriales bacterium]|nr:MAG: DASH family cryptochrome [Flavobacteriales bacterium]